MASIHTINRHRKVQRAPAPAIPPPSSPAPPTSAASRPSGLLRPSASPYRKARDENARATPLLKPQVKGDGAVSRSLRQPSLARPRREPATAALDTKAGARGVDSGAKDTTDVETSSGTMPEGTNVRSHRRSCAGPIGASGGGGSATASVWRWSSSQIRRRSPPSAGRDVECPRERTTATPSATGVRAPRPVASHTGPSTVEKDSCVAKQTLAEAMVRGGSGDVADTPLAPSVVQKTAVQKAKNIAGVDERPLSPRALSKAGFRDGERPALSRSVSSPCQRERKADNLEATSSLPRRRSTNSSFVVKIQSLASASTAEAAVPAFSTSGSSSRSSESSLNLTAGGQASTKTAVGIQGGILPETRPEESSAAINPAGARGSPVQTRAGISSSNSFSLGALALTPPGLRPRSRFPPLHAGSAGSPRGHRTDVSTPSAVPSPACGSSVKGLRQPRDVSRREEGGGSGLDAVSAPAGEGPLSENGVEPSFASATLSPAAAPLNDGGNRSRVEVFSPVVHEGDISTGKARGSGSAASSKLDSSLPLSWSSPPTGSCGGQAIPERKDRDHKQPEQQEGGGREKLEGNLCSELELARVCAGAFVEERRKGKVGPGVPGEPAVLSVASPGSDGGARGWLTRSNSDGFTFESSSDDESSGSDEEDLQDEDREGGSNERPASQEKASGWSSFMASFGHPYSDGGDVVIDPDLVQPGSSSSRSSRSKSLNSSAGSARTSSVSSSNGQDRATERSSWASSSTSAPRSTAMVGANCGPVGSAETVEIGIQTEAGPGVAHAVVQVGEGRLLSEEELREKATLEELRERLRMISLDLEAEVFHREVVKQEQEQLRRKLMTLHEEEIERLRWTIKEKDVEHNNEKIRMRWEHAEELDAERAELEDGGAAKDKLEEFQNMRERERDYHAKELEAERERVRETRAKLAEAERANREAARRHKKMEEMMRQLIEENEELRGFEEEGEAGDDGVEGDGEEEDDEEE